MSSVRTLLDKVALEARTSVARARLFRRVARQTGMVDTLGLGGVKALVKSRGRTNPSTMFRYHAANQPHRTALSYQERAYSYFEVDELMDRAAIALSHAGVAPGESVVLMLKNVPEMVFLQAGISRHGCAAVSVSWRSTPNELAYLIDNAGARAVFFDASVAEVVRAVLPKVRASVSDRAWAVRGPVDGMRSYEDFLAPATSVAARNEDRSEDGAVIVYTSGTTGKPKGAVRKFKREGIDQVLGFLAETPMRVGQTHLAVCPLYHSTAFGFVSLSFTLGSKVVLLDGFEPDSFLDAVERHRIDHTAVVPTMLHRLVALGPDAIRRRDTSSLKAIFTGGAQLTGALAGQVMNALGDKLYNFYGATETGFVTLATPQDLRRAPGTIGRAVPGNEIALLDDDRRPVPFGKIGELFVKSGNLVEGYHGNADATRESSREGFFSVGDLARQDEAGYYFIEGRKRDMIISGGVNLYPREIEAALSEHSAVGEAAVIGVPDDEWGERVVAFVVLAPGRQCSDAELVAHCRQHLSGPKCPRTITFVEELPRNPTGKVLKYELRTLAEKQTR